MALGWNEIRERAIAFAKEYENAGNEKSEAQTFLNDFYNVFGITKRRVATFEKRVPLRDGSGYIDSIWKGKILIEMKSRGKDLKLAYEQAKSYIEGLKESDVPKMIMVSDFELIHIHDLENDLKYEFELKNLYKNVNHFGFLAGYTKTEIKESDPINVKAAQKMGEIYDGLKESGYEGTELELYLVRLLFCLFADDTSIFDPGIFHEYLLRSSEDGEDLAPRLAKLYQILSTPDDKRNKNISDELMQFPYVNGALFEQTISMPSFNSKIRKQILSVCELDWSGISPAVFGSMFQSVMDQPKRRNLGAHYTSEKNILKLIKPLFLDELYEEFNKSKNNRKRLEAFHQKIANLKFLDPACGCGNFLIITYRELRLLEMEVIQAIHKGKPVLDISWEQKVNINQFYGIEIEEFPSLVAKTAMWLIDHQMNMELSKRFGQYFIKLPLTEAASIVYGNALTMDWNDVVSKGDLNYILGNPPFIGKTFQTKEQRLEMQNIFEGVQKSASLDYVAAWYKKSCTYIKSSDIEVAYVSTNSICQGEQVPVLWKHLFEEYNININFAYQTFKWSNEASGKAGVYVVIVGFSNIERKEKLLYTFESVKSEPVVIKANKINGYLIDSKVPFIETRSKPISASSPLVVGSRPADGGYLILNEKEYIEFITKEPLSKDYIKQLMGGNDFLNNNKRFCLWLKDCPPNILKQMPLVLNRVNKVRETRLKSVNKTLRKFADFPSQFQSIRQPEVDFLFIPQISSERRKYIPIGFVSKEIIVVDPQFMLPGASLYEFGILTSNMHMAWVKFVSGRLEMRYRYSASIVYNNFLWPVPTDKQKEEIEKLSQAVLNARDKYKDSSLADLYDPLFMPTELVKAHDNLDKAVEKAYGKTFNSDSDRVAHLFELYDKKVNGM